MQVGLRMKDAKEWYVCSKNWKDMESSSSENTADVLQWAGHHLCEQLSAYQTRDPFIERISCTMVF